MKKIYTLSTFKTTFFVTLIAVFIFSCSARVEKEVIDSTSLETTKTVKEIPVVTVATLNATAANKGYFDLIVETADCLGENLWIGGKLENITEEITGEDEFKVTQFTVTGLKSNLSYALENTEGTVKAVSTKAGIMQLQLQEGILKLRPISSSAQISIAYHTSSDISEYNSGYWSCK
jgi:hypothetical protein